MNPRIFSSISAAVACVALAGWLAGCSQKPSDAGVLCRVGNKEIRVEDFQRELDARLKSQRPPTNKQALLDEMIAREAQLQRARAAGLENDPEVQRHYTSLLITRLRELELSPRLASNAVSDAAVQAEYQKNLPRYTRPSKARLAVIHVKTDARMSEEKRAEARVRIEEARKLALALPPGARGFDRVALDYSEDHTTRYKGGDAGWFDDGQAAYRFPNEVIAAGFGLPKNGDVSEIITTPGGLFLVTRMDTRESSATPLAHVEINLRRRLEAEHRQQVEQQYLQETRRMTSVKTFPDTLATVDFPTTTVAKAKESLPPELPQ